MILLAALILSLTLGILFLFLCEADLGHTAERIADRAEARKRGSHQARLQYPHIDLSRCIGCGTCVKACPEEGVLDLVQGQSAVIHGARCVGHGLCAKECPVGAIQVTLGDLAERKDIPALTGQFEVQDMPGLFLAG
ncbi:MAG: 4Fe-4S dicluster domain-containing protein [Planctomycetota bacterium]